MCFLIGFPKKPRLPIKPRDVEINETSNGKTEQIQPPRKQNKPEITSISMIFKSLISYH